MLNFHCQLSGSWKRYQRALTEERQHALNMGCVLRLNNREKETSELQNLPNTGTHLSLLSNRMMRGDQQLRARVTFSHQDRLYPLKL